MSSNSIHTEDLPPLNADLRENLNAIRGIDPTLDRVADAFEELLTTRHTRDKSQTIVAALGAWEGRSLLSLIGSTVDRLADSDTNPSLRDLPSDQQKACRMHGETTAYVLSLTHIANFASNTAAAIDG